MRSTLDPSAAHDYDEPARPAWTFQQRSAAPAEKAEDDDLPDDQPVAVGRRDRGLGDSMPGLPR